MKLLRQLATHILLLGVLLVPTLAFSTVSAASPVTTGTASAVDDACAGIALAGSDCGSGGSGSASRISSVIRLIVNVLTAIVGIAAVIMIILGGFKYITSNGDASKITSAKNTIIYAIVGLVIVAVAQVIVRFVIGKVA